MTTTAPVASVPACFFCDLHATHDAIVTTSPTARWAYMCDRHAAEHGPGRYGLGIGQRLVPAPYEMPQPYPESDGTVSLAETPPAAVADLARQVADAGADSGEVSCARCGTALGWLDVGDRMAWTAPWLVLAGGIPEVRCEACAES